MSEIKDLENTLILETTKGRVVIELFADLAPRHVAQIRRLTKEGAYNNVVFHRVISGFMAQTGDVQFGKKDSANFDPKRVGTGGSNYPNIPAEFSNLSHKRGTVSMARSQNPDSANSQFFICFADAPWLDRQYSIWGQVIEGMENVDKIKHGEPVVDPDAIIKATVAADTK
ncbi:peptidyl-prolyl cis-trans isomerase [Bartonella quintana]|uniref:peptidylprolyl isomerase n=1 Tax=Bartonella quintana TaxID=803 RepID=UPI00027FCB86|nr:peptidylprolyl isomerase [Bartonella quintana]AFR26465.1 peptidyl prolyl cis-trans isomerase b [Bartonella quintana RM-11]BBL53237.1 peptidyl-prolyl cis-trans isomerase [Bartonella quintana]